MRIRQWRGDDERHLPSLLEPDADPLWVAQFHSLHGPDRDRPRTSGVQRWVASRPVRYCRNLSDMDLTEVARAYATVYEWIHEPWSAVTNNDLLLEVAAMEAAEVNRACSAGTWVDGRLSAVAFAFPSAEGFEVVAETMRHGETNGIDAVADAVAMVLRSVASVGGRAVSFDSHVSDPHLQPVLAELPHAGDDPLSLIEIA